MSGGKNRGDHGEGCGWTGNCGDGWELPNCGDHGELAATGGGSAGVSPAVNGGLNGDAGLLVTTIEGVEFVVIPALRGKVLGSSELKGVRVPGKKFVRLRKKFVRFRNTFVLNSWLVAPAGIGVNGGTFVAGGRFVGMAVAADPAAAAA